jgi:hypothetical protein
MISHLRVGLIGWVKIYGMRLDEVDDKVEVE